MNAHAHPDAWRLQILKLLQANPTLSQRQLAEQMGVSLGKANYCLRALVEEGLVKLGNFSNNPNKRQYAYLLTPAGMEEKTRIALAFLKRKETEFEAIRREIEVLQGELESSTPKREDNMYTGLPEVVPRQGYENKNAQPHHLLKLKTP
jgi:EPS-associated MarR family transcriptional regulator